MRERVNRLRSELGKKYREVFAFRENLPAKIEEIRRKFAEAGTGREARPQALYYARRHPAMPEAGAMEDSESQGLSPEEEEKQRIRQFVIEKLFQYRIVDVEIETSARATEQQARLGEIYRSVDTEGKESVVQVAKMLSEYKERVIALLGTMKAIPSAWKDTLAALFGEDDVAALVFQAEAAGALPGGDSQGIKKALTLAERIKAESDTPPFSRLERKSDGTSDGTGDDCSPFLTNRK